MRRIIITNFHQILLLLGIGLLSLLEILTRMRQNFCIDNRFSTQFRSRSNNRTLEQLQTFRNTHIKTLASRTLAFHSVSKLVEMLQTNSLRNFPDPEDDSGASCNSTDDFLCENRMCISRDLICDQSDNCQDGAGSDESRSWEVCGRHAKSESSVAYFFPGKWPKNHLVYSQ